MIKNTFIVYCSMLHNIILYSLASGSYRSHWGPRTAGRGRTQCECLLYLFISLFLFFKFKLFWPLWKCLVQLPKAKADQKDLCGMKHIIFLEFKDVAALFCPSNLHCIQRSNLLCNINTEKQLLRIFKEQ